MKTKGFASFVASGLLLLLTCLGAEAQSHGLKKGSCDTFEISSADKNPRYQCVKAAAPITVDGRLDEPAWSRTEVFRDFRLTNGEVRPTYPTEFRACWDSKYLYLAFVCTDPRIVAKHTTRDATVYEDDCVEAFLSSDGYPKRYFEFEFNPRNTQMDASVVFAKTGQEKTVDYGWNCAGLDSATRVEGKGATQQWTIEIALPFSEIGRKHKTPAVGEEWRANFYRIEYATRPEEFICWSPTILPSFHTPERIGKLLFMEKRAMKHGR